MTDPASPEIPHHEDHLDHCTCDLELRENEMTSDADLPAASGGVAAGAAARHDEDNVDGCDVDFSDAATADAELPAAVGGVA